MVFFVLCERTTSTNTWSSRNLGDDSIRILGVCIKWWRCECCQSTRRGWKTVYVALVRTFCRDLIWWRHQMEAFSALLALCAGNSPVPGEFPAQRPVTRSFDVFFDIRLNKQLNKQSWGWWFETLLRSLWRHRNEKKPHLMHSGFNMPGVFNHNSELLKCVSVCFQIQGWWAHGEHSVAYFALQWRHNEHDGVSNHQPHHCLLNRLFGCWSKKTSKLRVTGLCAGNSPGTGEFSAQMASNAENVSIWWRNHVVLEIRWRVRITAAEPSSNF